MQSVCAIPEVDIFASVLVSWVLRGEETKGLHTRYCGPSGVNPLLIVNGSEIGTVVL